MSVYPYALSVTLEQEGGYVHHPNDPGGATNKGVTQGRYDEVRQGLGLEVRPVQDIEQDELEAIYASYWEAVEGDELDPGFVATTLKEFEAQGVAYVPLVRGALEFCLLRSCGECPYGGFCVMRPRKEKR